MFVCLVRDSLSPSVPGVLDAVARGCSPRVQPFGADAVVCDARGLTRVIGAPVVIADEMRRMAWERGVGVRVAIAGSQTAAWLLAHVRPGTTIVTPGEERHSVDRLPLAQLRTLPPVLLLGRKKREVTGALESTLQTLEGWGLSTLGELARLPRAEMHTRLGALGVRLHQAACGEDEVPLVPTMPARRFVERLELEWPIEGLEPLSFVVARLCDAMAAALGGADRGAVSLTTRLHLVTRATWERTVTMPAPMREAKTLRTLIMLDLESHPAPAGIDVVEIECGVTPGRIVQGSLLSYPVPAPDDVSTLVARLQALAGDARVGAPAVVDTHNPRACALAPFVVAPAGAAAPAGPEGPVGPVIRRYRPPRPARVQVEQQKPVAVACSGLPSWQPVKVVDRAGPWRTSGQWWTNDGDTWERDEWDVALETGVILRLARDRRTDVWEVEGEVD